VLNEAAPLARSHADIVLASGRLTDLAEARDMAMRAVHTMRSNLIWAMTYNTCSVPLAVLGYMPPWAAGLGMALSSLLVIGNGLRLLRSPGKDRHGTAAA
jgi:Cu2+-exporting ATPase